MPSGANTQTNTQTHTYTHIPMLEQNDFKKPGMHGLWPCTPGVKIMPQWINVHQKNSFINRTKLPLQCKNSKAIHLP